MPDPLNRSSWRRLHRGRRKAMPGRDSSMLKRLRQEIAMTSASIPAGAPPQLLPQPKAAVR